MKMFTVTTQYYCAKEKWQAETCAPGRRGHDRHACHFALNQAKTLLCMYQTDGIAVHSSRVVTLCGEYGNTAGVFLLHKQTTSDHHSSSSLVFVFFLERTDERRAFLYVLTTCCGGRRDSWAGTIPVEIANLGKLQRIWLGENDLEGGSEVPVD